MLSSIMDIVVEIANYLVWLGVSLGASNPLEYMGS